MPRFFVKEENIRNDRIYIEGEDAHHIIRVLRMKVGEELTVCDFFNTEYRCTVCAVSGKSVELAILSRTACQSELPFPVTLYMALPKGDKMDFIVQKAVELGANRIVPFFSSFSVVKLDEKSAGRKRERWQKIARAAAEQCGRGQIPEVASPLDFSAALSDCTASGGLSFICDECEDTYSLSKLFTDSVAPERLSFFVGAEGGFDRKEICVAERAGIRRVTLGKRILRCETAPLYVLSCIGFTFEFGR